MVKRRINAWGINACDKAFAISCNKHFAAHKRLIHTGACGLPTKSRGAIHSIVLYSSVYVAIDKHCGYKHEIAI